MWSGCPRNPYSKNHKKKCNDKGELIMCTIEEMNDMLKYDYDDLIEDDLLDEMGRSTNDNYLTETFNCYSDVFTFSKKYYVFAHLMANDINSRGVNKH